MKKIIFTLSLLLFACNNQDTKEKLVVYQSPTCGCCSGWATNMQQNGFDIETIKTNDMFSAKVEAGIDVTLQSCHTAFIGGYFVEGHVPHDAIKKLLSERPNIKGITVPGMPAGPWPVQQRFEASLRGRPPARRRTRHTVRQQRCGGIATARRCAPPGRARCTTHRFHLQGQSVDDSASQRAISPLFVSTCLRSQTKRLKDRQRSMSHDQFHQEGPVNGLWRV